MIRLPPRSPPLYSSAASDVYKRQGKDISENATACPQCGEPMKKEQDSTKIVESGTEYFIVTAGNRFELAAMTNQKIQEVTQQLASQGKSVVNVHTTAPQPLRMVFTFWQTNVTLIWQRTR